MKLSIVAAIAFIHPALALANPTWSERLSATAVPGPHVLLTHAFGGSKPTYTVTEFHGTSHSDWVAGPDTSADTGSGSRTLSVRQMCDCHVPINSRLKYVLDSSSSWSLYGGGACDVMASDSRSGGPCGDECAAADARDAAVPADGPTPDIADASTTPDTGDAQDHDGATGTGGAGEGGASTVVATGGAPGSGGASAPISSAGSSASSDSTNANGTGANNGKAGGGSCTLALSARSPAVSALWLLAALALAVARRRRP